MPKRRADDTPRMIMTDHRIQRHPPAERICWLKGRSPRQTTIAVRSCRIILRRFHQPPRTRCIVVSRRWGSEIISPLACRNWRAKSKSRSRSNPSSTSCWVTPGGIPVKAGGRCRLPGSSSPASGFREGIARTGGRAWPMPEGRRLPRRYCRKRFNLRQRTRKPGTATESSISPWDAYRTRSTKFAKLSTLDPTLPEKSRRLAEILANAGKPDAPKPPCATPCASTRMMTMPGILLPAFSPKRARLAEAMFHFERAIRLRPTSAPHLYDYALALARADRFDEAQERAEASVRVDPNWRKRMNCSAVFSSGNRNWPRRSREYRRALVLRPEVARVHLRLGTVLAQQGKNPDAAQHLREAARDSDPAIAQQATRALERLGAR